MLVREICSPPREPRSASIFALKKVLLNLQRYVENDYRQENSLHFSSCQYNNRKGKCSQSCRKCSCADASSGTDHAGA